MEIFELPINPNVSYHIPFDIIINGLKTRKFSVETLSIITQVKKEKILEIFDLPLEESEIVHFDDKSDPFHKKGSKQAPTIADNYFMKWIQENSSEAGRFHSICIILLSKNKPVTSDFIRTLISDWYINTLKFSIETLSIYLHASVEDTQSFLQSTEKLSKETQYQIMVNALQFRSDIVAFMTNI
jgi:hypothetical protein